MLDKLKRIFNIPIKNYIVKEFKCFVFLIIYTVATLLLPTFVSKIIDKGITQKNLRLATLYSIGMLATGVIVVIFQYLQQTSFYKLGQELTIVIKQRIYDNVLRTNMKYWEKNSIGDTLIILGEDVSILENLLTTTVSNSIVNIIVITGISIFIIVMDWKCGVLILTMAILFAIIQKRIGGKIENIVVKMRKSIGEMANFTSETLQNANELQASGYEKLMSHKYRCLNKEVMDSTMKQIKAVTGAQSVGTLFNVLGLLVVIVFGTYQTITNNMTVGTLFVLTVYVQRLYGPIVSLGNSYIEIKNSIPKINNVIDILETPDIIKTGNYIPETDIQGIIEFNNVCFSYNEKDILKNFNLCVQPGEILGVVGKNGIGKSTLFKLILNLCTPNDGEILLDDMEIVEYENEFIREKIGYVGQEGFVISGRLIDILDPQKNSTETKILELMRELQLDITRFDQGLDTYIDENHRNLSGGEYQKIALIRSFIEDRDIYLLDEPTAAIDEKSEKEICKIIKEKLKGKTAIIITHRPKILEICDRVIDFAGDQNIKGYI